MAATMSRINGRISKNLRRRLQQGCDPTCAGTANTAAVSPAGSLAMLAAMGRGGNPLVASAAGQHGAGNYEETSDGQTAIALRIAAVTAAIRVHFIRRCVRSISRLSSASHAGSGAAV